MQVVGIELMVEMAQVVDCVESIPVVGRKWSEGMLMRSSICHGVDQIKVLRNLI